MHTVKFCKEQKRILVVLKHPSDLIDHPKTSGNAQLISKKQADIVFENDDDIDLVIREMRNEACEEGVVKSRQKEKSP